MHNLKAQDCTHKEVELPQLSKVHSAFQTLDCVPNIRMGLTKQAFTKGGVGVIVAQFLYDSRIQKTHRYSQRKKIFFHKVYRYFQTPEVLPALQAVTAKITSEQFAPRVIRPSSLASHQWKSQREAP